MGGKTGTTTSRVQIPPEVLARYNAVNTRAEQVAQTPFQQYSTDPNAFVAPLNSTQQAGVANTNAAAGIAQPYFQAATGAMGAGLGAAMPFTYASGQAVDPSDLNSTAINKYLSPYLGTVLGTTMAAQGQQNAQQRSAMQGDAIQAGAFGGDRAGIGQANLAYQQNLSNSQTIANILNQGYGQALSTAQQQQGLGLSAEQANRAAYGQAGQNIYNQFSNYGQGLAGLGTGAQGAALQGAQAQLAAGQVGQQTQQAGLSALYNQFLQQQSYPFQVTQFLGNIAMGTGALSGSQTSTTQPMPFFSDERLKEDIEPIGETYDGQKIVKFRYKGQQQKQIGLLAQDVERHHPEAVGQSHGYKTVDYDAATANAAYEGGLGHPNVVRMADHVRKAGGGLVGAEDARAFLQAQQAMYSALPWAQAGLYGGQAASGVRGGVAGHVPAPNLHVAPLVTAKAPSGGSQQTGMQQVMGGLGDVERLVKGGESLSGLYDKASGWLRGKKPDEQTGNDGRWDNAAGGIVPFRLPRAAGGFNDDEDDTPLGLYKHPAGLNIPQVNANAKLSPPNTPSGGQSGGSGMGDISGLIGNVAKILPFFLKDGGAVPGYADGGAPEDGIWDVPLDATDTRPTGLSPRRPRVDPAMARDYAIRTTLAEAGNEPELGQAAVAHVIRNRVNSGRWGDNARDVVLAPKQFSPWNMTDGNDPRRFKEDSPEYQRAAKIWDDVNSGRVEDPTGGALHFANIGASTAGWPRQALARGPDSYTQIGNHTFFRGLDVGAPPVGQETPSAGLAAASIAHQEAPRAAGLAAAAPMDANISEASDAPARGLAPASSFGQTQGEVMQPRQRDWMDRNRDWLLPALGFIGKAASSNSRYLGAALLQGAAGAAEGMNQAANLEQKQQGIDTGRMAQNTSAATLGLQQQVQQHAMAINAYDPKTGQFIVIGSDGRPTRMLARDFYEAARAGKMPRLLPGGIPGVTTAPAPTSSAPPVPEVAPPKPEAAPEPRGVATPAKPTAATKPDDYVYTVPIGDAGKRELEAEQRLYETQIPNEEQKNAIVKQQQALQQQAQHAQDNRQQLLELADVGVRPGGFLATGPTIDNRITLSQIGHLMAKVWGIDLGTEDLSNAEIARKLHAAQAATTAQAMGERSAIALPLLAQGLANGSLSSDSVKQMIADNLAAQQRQIDLGAYAKKYAQGAQGVFPVGANVTNAFSQEYGQDFYNKERNNLIRAMTPVVVDQATGAKASPIHFLINPRAAEQYPSIAKDWNPYTFEHFFGPGSYRYISGRVN